MKQYVKKIILVMAVFALAGLIAPIFSIGAEAAETGLISGEVMARVVVPEEVVFATVARTSTSGVVDGDGVRLRKKPEKTATILELMGFGENVSIHSSKSTADWYYITRKKTGTEGYADKHYIYVN